MIHHSHFLPSQGYSFPLILTFHGFKLLIDALVFIAQIIVLALRFPQFGGLQPMEPTNGWRPPNSGNLTPGASYGW